MYCILTVTSIPPPAALHRALSGARLALFKTFFKSSSDSETWGAYQWHEAVRASLLPIVGFLEVSLRNVTHQAISQMTEKVNSTNWYDSTNTKGLYLRGGARRQADELLARTDQDSGQPLVTSPDEFVANASFGFWVEALLQVEKGRTYRLAKAMFPGYPPVADAPNWGTSLAWDNLVKKRLRKLKKFRDAVAHFYPLVTWQYEQGGKWFVPSSPGAAMISMRQEVSRALLTLQEIDPTLTSMWLGTFAQAQFMQLTTSRALMAFQGGLPLPTLSFGGDARFRFLSDLWTTPQLKNLKAFTK